MSHRNSSRCVALCVLTCTLVGCHSNPAPASNPENELPTPAVPQIAGPSPEIGRWTITTSQGPNGAPRIFLVDSVSGRVFSLVSESESDGARTYLPIADKKSATDQEVWFEMSVWEDAAPTVTPNRTKHDRARDVPVPPSPVVDDRK